MTDKCLPITPKYQNISARFDFSHHVEIPDDVMMREIGGEAVIVNLNSEAYFGLDDIGTHMWTLLTASKSIQAAFNSLMNEYDVEEEQLRSDLSILLGKLIDHGLLVLKDDKSI